MYVLIKHRGGRGLGTAVSGHIDREVELSHAVEVRAATQEEKPVLKWLLELYVSEFNLMKGSRLHQKQVFIDEDYIDLFWVKEKWVPLLIFYHGKAAGFALVVSNGFVAHKAEARALPDFFVLKKYRRMGVGRQAAFEIFNRYPGRWEILQSDFNSNGQAFWRRVVEEYTCGQFAESFLNGPDWIGPVQVFETAEDLRPRAIADL